MARFPSLIAIGYCARFALLLPAVVLVFSGCGVVIEKQTVVIDLDDSTDEIRILFLYEGISADADQKDASVPCESISSGCISPEQVFFAYVEDRSSIGRRNMSFFSKQPEKLRKFYLSLPNTFRASWDRLMQLLDAQVSIEDFTYFTEPSRVRTLCAEQRVTIGHRDEIIQALNEVCQEYAKYLLTNGLHHLLMDRDGPVIDILMILEKRQEPYVGSLRSITALGWIFTAILEHLDESSIERLKEAVNANHLWWRYTPGEIEFVVPVTEDCARRIVDGEIMKLSLKGMQSVVSQIRVEARAEGLAMVLGAHGKPLTFILEDRRPHAPQHDAALLNAAENAALLNAAENAALLNAAGNAALLNDKNALLKLRGLNRDGRDRIDLFLRRSTAPKRIWKSADGQFEVEATLEELDGEVATLRRLGDGRLIEVTLDRLHTDDKSWLKGEAERMRQLPPLETSIKLKLKKLSRREMRSRRSN